MLVNKILHYSIFYLPTGVSKLVSCIRALPSTFTRADVDHCYDTVFNTGGSTASSVGGASSAGGSTLGTP